MAFNISERHRVVPIIKGVSSTYFTSEGISLQDVGKVNVFCGCGVQVVTPDATNAVFANASVSKPATFKIMVGPSTDPATAALVGATVVMGAQGTVLTNWDTIEVGACGTVSGLSGNIVIINGVTYTLTANSCVKDFNLLTSNASGVIGSLSCAIGMHHPGLFVHDETSGKLLISRKNADSLPITAQVTAQGQSTEGLVLMGIKQQRSISFTPANVVATNSSYTHFAVQIETTCSAAANPQYHAFAVLETGINIVSPGTRL